MIDLTDDHTDDLTAALASPKIQEELRPSPAFWGPSSARCRFGGDRFVDAEEAAQVLGMTNAAARKAAARATLTTEWVGRRLRFSLSGLLSRSLVQR